MEKTFWSLKGLAKTGQLDLESLAPLISPTVPAPALNGVFSAFDENRDGHIDFKELCCGVSAACRGPNVERSKCMFKFKCQYTFGFLFDDVDSHNNKHNVFFLFSKKTKQFASKCLILIVTVC